MIGDEGVARGIPKCCEYEDQVLKRKVFDDARC